MLGQGRKRQAPLIDKIAAAIPQLGTNQGCPESLAFTASELRSEGAEPIEEVDDCAIAFEKKANGPEASVARGK